MLSQLIQLLSEPPGNVIYHLVTLFALQAALAISLSQWRRNRDDAFAGRMAVAAGIILIARLGFLLAGLLAQERADTFILPPLEQAIHTVTAVLLVWALVPHSRRWPRLGHALLAISLIFIAVGAIFFVQRWQAEALNNIPYNSSDQVTFWGIGQLAVLATGLSLLLGNGRLRFSLRTHTIALLFLAHLIHFWNAPEIIPTDTNVTYWLRLGQLTVFPLWAVLAYRHSLVSLLAGKTGGEAIQARVGYALQLATSVIGREQPVKVIEQSVVLGERLLPAVFVGIIIYDDERPNQLRLYTTQAQEQRQWNLNLDDWPAMRLVLESQHPVELRSGGMGARQLRLLYEEIGLRRGGPLLIHPLLAVDNVVGLLLLAKSERLDVWPASERELVTAVADYLARAIHNSRQRATAPTEEAALPPTASDLAPAGRLISLESERDRLATELEGVRSRAQEAERRAAAAQKRAQDLANTVEELEQTQKDEKVETLQAEMETLRASLIEAEEAMAMAAASERGLSTEWVTMAITRYSGQLEEAQKQIEELERELNQRSQEGASHVVASLAQELRTPMTSIAGYTDLLLSETVGILGAKQRDFLQRVKANIERLSTLMDQLIQAASVAETSPREGQPATDVQAVVETAIQSVINQIREKQLRLNMTIADDIPPLPVDQDALRQMVIHLLDNACQVSTNRGRLALQVQAHNALPFRGNGRPEPIHFVHIAVEDHGGGIRIEDRPHVFNPQYRADHPLIEGLGDTGAGLATVKALAENNSGRVWVDSQPGEGSTFSVLLPVLPLETAVSPTPSDQQQTNANGRNTPS